VAVWAFRQAVTVIPFQSPLAIQYERKNSGLNQNPATNDSQNRVQRMERNIPLP
jgi:hypothetical protein